MPDHQDKINLLYNKLQSLLEKQERFSREIDDLRLEIEALRTGGVDNPAEKKEFKAIQDFKKTDPLMESEKNPISASPPANPIPAKVQPPVQRPVRKQSAGKSNLEKFIGENLISKIGIIITVIGVAIGAKYAIDHQLISPLTRIILGYLAGVVLLALAIRLKKQYENFSAVLLSGSMAILYFITYAAYSFYDLIPQTATFLLMLLFTAFTVLAAIKYDRQVIAHIGMVGAYAVPFLLSDGSGRILILFSYIAMINAGILFISFKKNWKPLYNVSFVLTWLIYGFWFVLDYLTSEHFGLALTFLTIYFLSFYIVFLAYKLVRKEQFNFRDIIALLTNSFIFYGFGYLILKDHKAGSQLLGLFTLGNAIVHTIVGLFIHRQKLADRNLFYLVFGLVMVFTTIAIPVQLDGNWVTMLWAGEAALLFWIGRTRNVSFYEKLSLPLMLLAAFSLFHDWTSEYHSYRATYPETRITPFLNIFFLTALLVIAAFGWIFYINQKKTFPDGRYPLGKFSKPANIFIAVILVFTVYYAVRIEIETYWNQLYLDSAFAGQSQGNQFDDYGMRREPILYGTIWVINYSLIFVSVLAFVNLKKIHSVPLGFVTAGLIILSLLVFLTQGLYALSELRVHYLNSRSLSNHTDRGVFDMGVRYVSYLFAGLSLVSLYLLVKKMLVKRYIRIGFDLVLHVSVLWIASSEVIHWMELTHANATYKLELSILWGVYSLFLIFLGIRQKRKHLRIGAIILFGVTLLKLFFYDIYEMGTIAKTVVFISLGALLLIISFLYNKYKHIITDEGVS